MSKNTLRAALLAATATTAVLTATPGTSAVAGQADDPEQNAPKYEVGVDDGLVCQSDDPVGHSLCIFATGVYHLGKWIVEDGYADAEREAKRVAKQVEREAKRIAEQTEREAKRIAEQTEREAKRIGNQIASAFKLSF